MSAKGETCGGSDHQGRKKRFIVDAEGWLEMAEVVDGGISVILFVTAQVI